MRAYAAILVLLLAFAAQAQGTQHYTVAQANETLSNATAYVNIVNESGYLVFWPNLTQAYSYLNKSRTSLNGSPDSAVMYAGLAAGSAKASYERIGAYREDATLAALAFTVVMAVMLYRFMKPVKKNRNG